MSTASPSKLDENPIPNDSISIGWLGVAGLWLGLLLIPLSAAWSRSADLAHGWAAVFLMLHLWHERLPSDVPRPPRTRLGSRAVILVCLVAVVSLLRLFLEPFPLWPGALTLHALALIALGGLAAYHFGGHIWVKWLLAPTLLIAGALPWPSVIDRAFIHPLREGLATVAAELLGLMGQPAIAQGTSVRLAGGWVGIDEACGGIRSLQAAVMLALFFGELSRHHWARRIMLVVAGVVAALVGNFARILFLSFAATGGHDKVDDAHDIAGWLALGLTLSGVAAIAWFIRPKSTPSAAPNSTANEPRSVPFAPPRLGWALTPLLAIGCTELGVRLWFNSGESLRSQIPQWEIRLPTQRSSYREEPLGDLARDMLRPDEYHAGQWRDDSGERAAAYSIDWRTGQMARVLPFLHNPTVCLPLAGCELIEALPERSFQLGALTIPFRSYRFARAGEAFIVSFVVWDPSRGEPLRQAEGTTAFLDWLVTRWAEVAERRRNQPAQMFCLAVYGSDIDRRTEKLLQSLIVATKSE